MHRTAQTPIVIWVFLMLVHLGFPQAGGIPKLELTIRETVTAPGEWAGPLMVPIKCDAAGNLYFRGYNAAKLLAAPVVKITPEGKRDAVFSLDSVPQIESGEFYDFTVSLRGEVFLLALTERNKEQEVDLVSFASDGKYESAKVLAPLFMPSQVAVFASGEFLVSGLKLSQKEGAPPDKPFVSLFDRNGVLIKEVVLSDNVESQKPRDETERSPVFSAVSLGTAINADDGNIYLMRRTSNPVIFVVSHTGRVVRRLVIAAPAENSRPITMKVAAGKVAVMFEESKPASRRAEQIVFIADAETGEGLAEYHSTPGIGGALACYTPNRFTFIGSTQDGHLAVQGVVPK